MAMRPLSFFSRDPLSGSAGGGGGLQARMESDFDPFEAASQRSLQNELADKSAAARLREAQIQANAATAGVRAQQNRFKQIFPLIKSQLSGAFGGGLGGGAATAGGSSGSGPAINANPIFSGSQIQQQVNAATAANDQRAQTQARLAREQTAGHGFGAQSPLARALEMGAQNQAMAANTANEREIRLGATGRNAAHVLDAQRAQEEQYASRMREDIERRKPYFQQQQNMLAVLAGLV